MISVVKRTVDEDRLFKLAAAESQAIGKGGIAAVARATGISRPVIREGIAELNDPSSVPPGRIRQPGGGRRKAVDKDPSLKTDLEELLESTTRGDPQAPLRWTAKSVGMDHDTAEFAVETIRRWWRLMGQPVYPSIRGYRREPQARARARP